MNTPAKNRNGYYFLPCGCRVAFWKNSYDLTKTMCCNAGRNCDVPSRCYQRGRAC